MLSQRIREALDRLRTKLLDLSGRNRLLNFKFSDRSRRFVRVVDEVPDQLYARLADDSGTTRKMYVVGLEDPPELSTDEPQTKRSVRTAVGDDPSSGGSEVSASDSSSRKQKISPTEWAQIKGINPSFELPVVNDGRAAHDDDRIQTLLFNKDLAKKLAAIREEDHLTQQEIGLSTLHVAFGFLEWYESDSSQESRFAPLILLPVQIERELSRGRYRYFIQSGEGADPLINITLRERILRDFGFMLPDLEDGDSTEAYFTRVQKLLQSHPRWKVRRMVVIGHFSFARLAMYEDLSAAAWSQAPLELNSLIGSILGGGSAAEQLAEDDVAPDSDEAAKEVPVLITDADSSQFAAVLDAMQGRSFALKGPPGTGKSQTITNLIASALAKGMQVLFVAEKMAALNVVSDRLRVAGLAPFVLELHSTKSQKKQVLDSLSHRLGIRYPDLDHTLAHSTRQLKGVRDELKDYVEALNTPIKNTGYTLHQALWEEQRARRPLDDDQRFELAGLRDDAIVDLDPDDLAARSGVLNDLATYWEKCSEFTGNLRTHPLNGIMNMSRELSAPGSLRKVFSTLADANIGLQSEVAMLCAKYEHPVDDSLVGARQLAEQLRDVPTGATVDPALVASLQSVANRSVARAFIEACRSLSVHREQLGRLTANPDAAIANGEQLRQCVVAADSAADRLGVERGFTGYANLRRSIESVDHVLDVCARLVAHAGLSLPLTPKALLAFLKALSLLRSIPPSALAHRSARVRRPDCDQMIAKLSAEAGAIRQLQRTLASRVRLDRLPGADELITDADVLRRMNAVAGLFSSKYRAAKRCLSTISLEGRKYSKSEGVEILTSAAELMVRQKAFQDDVDLAELAGKGARGLDTNFAALKAAAEFSRRCSTTLSALYDEERVFRQILEETDERTLLEANRLVEETQAKQALDWLRQFGTGAANLRELLAEQMQICDAARSAHENLVRLGVSADGINEPSALLKELDSAGALLTHIEECRDSLPALKAYAIDRPSEVARCAITVDLVESIANSPLPAGARRALLSERFDAVRQEIGIEAASLRERISVLDERLAEAMRTFGLDVGAWTQMRASDVTCSRLSARCGEVVALREATINEWDRLNRLRTRATTFGMVQPILDLLNSHKITPPQLAPCYRFVFFRSLIAAAQKMHPNVEDWSGERMTRVRSSLSSIDRGYLKVSQQWLASSLSRRAIPRGVSSSIAKERSELALIEHEIGKQRRHLPIRKLLERAGTAARALKPCVMMSPASVAQFLSSSQEPFDLLIVDEASQMRPEEAIGALARCKQAVVVGDPLQLPPTSFFDAGHDEAPENEEEEQVDIDTESILDMALSNWRPHRDLRWHYRSRHHSLIDFSNREFYGDRLVVFPSPQTKSAEAGIELVNVDDGVYRSHVNEVEAARVIECVARLVSEGRDKSIGVVAMNQPQRDLLLEMFDLAFAQNPLMEAYRQRWSSTLESFFVKNLENVQGDERDYIVISTVYGPAQPGGPVAQRFGPINSKIGHRRLNVLLTRAKEKVVLISTLKPEHILLQPTSSTGVAALKRYLEFARSGRLETGDASGGSFESPFEAEVAETVREFGFQVASQVGVAGYFIDLAVRHPQQLDHFILGIECDGATYHSAKSARDRDRLRQEMLERLGWTLYRIWSTDWFANRQREVARLRQFIESCVRRAS